MRYCDKSGLVLRGSICQTLVRAFDLSICAQTSHTPAPLQRGELNAIFLLVMKGLSGGVSPLERGELGAASLLVMRVLWCCVSPLERGVKILFFWKKACC